MKRIEKTISTGEIRDLIHQYFEARTSIYFMPSHHGEDRWTVDGDIDLHDLAQWIAAEVSPCPCPCEQEEFTGRWTSGDFTGRGPLTSAYTCEEHSALVAAWCHLNTGLEPVWVPAPAGRWQAHSPYPTAPAAVRDSEAYQAAYAAAEAEYTTTEGTK